MPRRADLSQLVIAGIRRSQFNVDRYRLLPFQYPAAPPVSPNTIPPSYRSSRKHSSQFRPKNYPATAVNLRFYGDVAPIPPATRHDQLLPVLASRLRPRRSDRPDLHGHRVLEFAVAETVSARYRLLGGTPADGSVIGACVCRRDVEPEESPSAVMITRSKTWRPVAQPITGASIGRQTGRQMPRRRSSMPKQAPSLRVCSADHCQHRNVEVPETRSDVVSCLTRRRKSS